MKFLPDGRLLVVELAGRIRVLSPPYTSVEPDAVPADHQHRLGRCAAGHLRHRARPELRDQPLLLRLLHARHAEPRPGVALHGQRVGSPARSPAASSSSTRTRRTPTPSTTAARSTSATTASCYFTTGEHFDAAGVAGPDATRAARSIGSTRTARCRRTTRSTTAPGRTTTRSGRYGLRNPFRAYYDAPTGRLYHRRRRRQRLRDGQRGGQRRRSRAPTTAGRTSRARAPAPCTTPALLLRPQRARRVRHGRLRLPRRPVPERLPGQLLLRRLHPELDQAPDVRRATATSTACSTSSRRTARVDGPYGDIVYLTEGPDGALYYVDLGYSDIGGTFGVSKIRRIRFISAQPAADRDRPRPTRRRGRRR